MATWDKEILWGSCVVEHVLLQLWGTNKTLSPTSNLCVTTFHWALSDPRGFEILKTSPPHHKDRRGLWIGGPEKPPRPPPFQKSPKKQK